MEPLHQTVANEPAVPSMVRRWLRDWLARAGWAREDTEDLVLAVSEAVSNSVEHAYPHPGQTGFIVVHAALEITRHHGRQVLVTVSDHGQWRPVPEDPGHRGRGITLMHAFTDQASIDTGETGTTVSLLSREVPSHHECGFDALHTR